MVGIVFNFGQADTSKPPNGRFFETGAWSAFVPVLDVLWLVAFVFLALAGWIGALAFDAGAQNSVLLLSIAVWLTGTLQRTSRHSYVTGRRYFPPKLTHITPRGTAHVGQV